MELKHILLLAEVDFVFKLRVSNTLSASGTGSWVFDNGVG